MTGSDPATTRLENERNTALLVAELPSARLVDSQYLHWLYDEAPYGPAAQASADDEGVRVAHYAMISQRYRGQRGQAPAGFSLHAVVRTGAQRRGWFRTLAPEVYDQASGFRWRLRPACATTSRSAPW
jgi:hypothetical protein